MDLPHDLLRWVADITGSGVSSCQPLTPATTASVYRLRLESGARLVMKRYDIDDPYDQRPHRAAHEAEVLEMLARSAVPAPGLIAADRDGSSTGVATLLMDFVPGTTLLTDEWLEEMIDVVLLIHDTDPGGVDWEYERYAAKYDPWVPAWATDATLWHEVLAAASSSPPDTPHGFIHRDLHAGNVLWSGGGIAGVIDWMSACVGPLAIDTAHFRANLAMDHGIETADGFLEAYLAGVSPETWHPYWDLVDAVDFLPYWAGIQAVDSWRWDDRPAAETRARFEEYLGVAMAELHEMG